MLNIYLCMFTIADIEFIKEVKPRATSKVYKLIASYLFALIYYYNEKLWYSMQEYLKLIINDFFLDFK